MCESKRQAEVYSAYEGMLSMSAKKKITSNVCVIV